MIQLPHHTIPHHTIQTGQLARPNDGSCDHILLCTCARWRSKAPITKCAAALTSRAFSSRLWVKIRSASVGFEPSGMDGIIIAHPWISIVYVCRASGVKHHQCELRQNIRDAETNTPFGLARRPHQLSCVQATVEVSRVHEHTRTAAL
eukprot:COSAG02_NODE_20803_length_815_cov_0.980447_1_plen_148_part_00